MTQPVKVSETTLLYDYETMEPATLRRKIAEFRDPTMFDQNDPELAGEIATAEGFLEMMESDAPENQPSNPLFDSAQDEAEILQETRERNARRYGARQSQEPSPAEPSTSPMGEPSTR